MNNEREREIKVILTKQASLITEYGYLQPIIRQLYEENKVLHGTIESQNQTTAVVLERLVVVKEALLEVRGIMAFAYGTTCDYIQKVLAIIDGKEKQNAGN